MYGLGLDENTAVVVKGHQFRVIGENAATLVDVSETSHSNLQKLRKGEGLALWGVKLDVLPDGYGFDIKNQKPILEEVNRREILVAK
jgi:cyanophycinase